MRRPNVLIEDYSEENQMLPCKEGSSSRKCVNVSGQLRAQPQVCLAQHIIRTVNRTRLALPVAVRLPIAQRRTLSHVTAAAAVQSHGDYQQASLSSQHAAPWQIVSGVCAIAMLLCSMHRNTFTMLLPLMAEGCSFTLQQQGMLHAAMLVGYLAGQLPAGQLADKFGGDRVLMVGLLLWSLATAATGLAGTVPASMSFTVVVLARLAMGLFSAAAMPAVSAMASRWVPQSSKASTIAVIYACFNLGGVLGAMVTPLLAERFLWQGSFAVAALGGVIWSLVGLATISNAAAAVAATSGSNIPASATATRQASTTAHITSHSVPGPLQSHASLSAANAQSAPKTQPASVQASAARFENAGAHAFEPNTQHSALRATHHVTSSAEAESGATRVPFSASGLSHRSSGVAVLTSPVTLTASITRTRDVRYASNAVPTGSLVSSSSSSSSNISRLLPRHGGSAGSSMDSDDSHSNNGASSPVSLEASSSKAAFDRKDAAVQFVVLCWAHACIGWSFFIMSAYLPQYLKFLGISSLTSTGFLAGLPFLAAAMVGAVAGGFADKMLAANIPRLQVRRMMHAVSTLGYALVLAPLVVPGFSPSPTLATGCLIAGFSANAFSFGGFHAYVQDIIEPQSAGVMLGLTNSCSIVMGILGTLVVPAIVSTTGSYQSVFLITAALHVSSFVAFTGLLKGRPLLLRQLLSTSSTATAGKA